MANPRKVQFNPKKIPLSCTVTLPFSQLKVGCQDKLTSTFDWTHVCSCDITHHHFTLYINMHAIGDMNIIFT